MTFGIGLGRIVNGIGVAAVVATMAMISLPANAATASNTKSQSAKQSKNAAKPIAHQGSAVGKSARHHDKSGGHAVALTAKPSNKVKGTSAHKSHKSGSAPKATVAKTSTAGKHKAGKSNSGKTSHTAAVVKTKPLASAKNSAPKVSSKSHR